MQPLMRAEAECNLMMHRFILTHFPWAMACLGFDHVHSKCPGYLGLVPNVWPVWIWKKKKRNRRKSQWSRGMCSSHSLTLTHTCRWDIFPEALCFCGLSFQTISISLIILITHFYTWNPLLSQPPACSDHPITLSNEELHQRECKTYRHICMVSQQTPL